MPTIEETIRVERAPHDVFEFATDPDNVPLYSSNLVHYEKTSEGPIGVGATYAGDVKVAGKLFHWTAESAEFNEDRSWTMKSMESPMPWEIHVDLIPDNGGTRVEWRQEIGNWGSFFGKLADPIVTKMYSKDVKSNLEKLKLLLED